jgi:hypothetical protein
MSERICQNCGLREMPAMIGARDTVSFIDEKTCQFCDHFARHGIEIAAEVEKSEQRFKEIFTARKGNGAYDVVLLYTGGKDSAYTLQYLVKELGLKVLALTWDNGFFEDINALDEFPKILGVDHKVVRMDRGILADFFRNRMRVFGRFCTCPVPALIFSGTEILESGASAVVISLSFAQNLFMIQTELAPKELAFVDHWRDMAVMSFDKFQPIVEGTAMVEFISGDLSEETLVTVRDNLAQWRKMKTPEKFGVRAGMIIPWEVPTIYEKLEAVGWKRHVKGKGRTHTSCLVEECKGYVAYSQDVVYSDVLEISAERRAGLMSADLYQKELLGLGYCEEEPTCMEQVLDLTQMIRSEFIGILQERRIATHQAPVVNPRHKDILCPEKSIEEVQAAVNRYFPNILHM